MSIEKYINPKLLTTSSIKKIEKIAINQYNIQELLLIENAATFVADFIHKNYRDYQIIIIAGPGNNGQDARALGRILYSKNYRVSLFNYKFADPKSNSFHVPSIPEVPSSVPNKTLVIDGLFGIGINRSFSSELLDIIHKINNLDCLKLSLDLPSGLCGDTGKIIGGQGIIADFTFSFIAPKIGLYLFPGNNYAGTILSSNLSIPEEIIIPDFTHNTSPNFTIKRARNTHKTTFGKTYVIAGCSNYYGAPYFSAMASLLSGSGYTTLFSDQSVIDSVSAIAPEIIFRDFSEIIDTKLQDSIVIYGPGLNNKNYLREVIIKKPKIIIIDGDGLNHMDNEINLLNEFKGSIIITPHPLEASRLLKKEVEGILDDTIGSARELSTKYGSFTVLKGAHTVISDPMGNVTLNTKGSPTLATAGSGDILCGILAGLSCYLPTNECVSSGVYLHGYIGSYLEELNGTIGITSRDILNAIPEAIKGLTYHP